MDSEVVMAGRFKKLSRIGRGTFGEAWLVSSTWSGRKYVIKEVRVEEMSSEELERTRTEATILARCKHTSIIRYKEYFMMENPATMCLVMEYADGGDLSLLVKAAKKRREMLPERSILNWFVQVIIAVQYLHINNILHRDLKTQNIFLTKTNVVKVGDFGISRFLRDKQDLATTAIGTPYYLSPEICQRRPYNQKSDMWAVGCVLYELCALTHPFQANCFDELLINILSGVYKPLPPKSSILLQGLTKVLLRTKPERRPSADALLLLPALQPYVEIYLIKHEGIIAPRSRQHSGNTAQEHKDAVKRDGVALDVPRINALKRRRCGSREGGGSVDLCHLYSRKEAAKSEVDDASGEKFVKPRCVSDSAVRSRCVSDSAVGLEPNSHFASPKITSESKLGIQDDIVFVTPKILLRNKVKKRVDTPIPKPDGRNYYPSCQQLGSPEHNQINHHQKEHNPQEQKDQPQQEHQQLFSDIWAENKLESPLCDWQDSPTPALQEDPGVYSSAGETHTNSKTHSGVGFGATYVVRRHCDGQPSQ